ncbi:hypothetical protein Ancab_038099 [Ancistrocladus abbreviatus]
MIKHNISYLDVTNIQVEGILKFELRNLTISLFRLDDEDFIDNGEDEQEDDVEDIARRLQERYCRSSQVEYGEETTDVEQQALLPFVKDTKLWMVKFAIGREREVAVCLMQKFIDRGCDLQIQSIVALDHLKNYIYIEADKEAYVREVVDVDNVRELHIHVEHRRDPMTGEYFENTGGMMFKDGFVYKTMSMKSISTQNIQPTFDELEKFRQPNEGDGDIASLSTLFVNRKKGHFMKGDVVIVVKGDLKILKGSEVMIGITGVGHYELHDLVLLEYAGIPDRPEVVLVRLREIKSKIDDKTDGELNIKNKMQYPLQMLLGSRGPSKGKQGPIEHIYRGVLFIYDRHSMLDLCVLNLSLVCLFGGSWSNREKILSLPPRGPSMDCDQSVILHLMEGQEVVEGMIHLLELLSKSAFELWVSEFLFSSRDMPRHDIGSETPMHPSHTPTHHFMTPMRDLGAYAPSPCLPSTPGQPMTPSSTFCLPGTPGVQPMTPGGAVLDMMSPMTGLAGRDDFEISVEAYYPSFFLHCGATATDVVVVVLWDSHALTIRFMQNECVGCSRDLLDKDGSCRLALGSSGSGEMVTALPNEIEVILPKKSDKIKIMGGGQRGATGKLIGVDGTDGIVKVYDTLDVKILDMAMLAKLAQA